MNLNPLIPLDGYYALSDYLEVPNLRQRAGRPCLLADQNPGVPSGRAGTSSRRAGTTHLPDLWHPGGRIHHPDPGLLCRQHLWLAQPHTRQHRNPDLCGGWSCFPLRRQLLAWKDFFGNRISQADCPAEIRPGSVAAAGRCRRGAHPWMSDPLADHRLRPVTVWSGASLPLTAPDSGMVGQVNVREGSRVETGARCFGFAALAWSGRRLCFVGRSIRCLW